MEEHKKSGDGPGSTAGTYPEALLVREESSHEQKAVVEKRFASRLHRLSHM